MGLKTYRHGVLTFSDGAATVSTELSPGVGDFSISGLEEGNVEAVPVYGRGVFLGVVKGNEKAYSGSITVFHDDKSTGTNKILDAVMKLNSYSGKTTKDPEGVLWTGDLVWVGTDDGGIVDTYTLTNCRLVVDYSEGQPTNTYTVNFTAYGTGSANAFAAS